VPAFLLRLVPGILFLTVLIQLAHLKLSFEIIFLSDEVSELLEEIEELREDLDESPLSSLMSTVSNLADVEGVYEYTYHSSDRKASFK
jgi:predicted house-cleaning noncanonical NTP pyrophosphatase (MazG superfamily)